MTSYFPRGNRLSALEQNVLKHRALEMVLILFYVEDLREFVVGSIRSTDQLRATLSSVAPRLPKGTKNLYKKAWGILVDDGILSSEESDEIQRLLDYRNTIAHAPQKLTVDIGRSELSEFYRNEDGISYDSGVLRKVKAYARKIQEGMGSNYLMQVSFRSVAFEAAERTYMEELRRLRARIRRQAEAYRREISEVNANIAELPSGFVEKLQPGHPNHLAANGTLTSRGATCCYGLFHGGASPLSVAYLMRISLRAAKARYETWRDDRELGAMESAGSQYSSVTKARQ